MLKEIIHNKKIQSTLVIILLVSIIFFGAYVRLQNLPLLIDQTTNQYIPLALDPFYFLRLAETQLSLGELPEVDPMRNPSLQIGYTTEILPQVILYLYKFVKVFNEDITIRYIDVLYPVIFFVLSLILFFLLILTLTNSKWLALLSSGFLAICPPFLHRTMAGFSDHEALGIFAFFLVLLIYTLSIKSLKKNNYIKIILFSLATGFTTILTMASWGGVVNFVFMIIPLSLGILWLMESKENLLKYIIFYTTWIVSTIIFGLLFKFPSQRMINALFLETTSLLVPFLFVFMIVDYLLISRKEEHRVLISGSITLVLGVILLILIKGDLSILINIAQKLLHPFGTERIGLTVAENRQPYLTEWITQIGKNFFWVFYIGLLSFGFAICEKIKENKNKLLLGISWAIMVSGILFSRLSTTSLLNGETLISNFFLGGGIIFFFGVLYYLYHKKDLEIDSNVIIILVWSFFMLLAVRGAMRLFFLITPLLCFMASYSLFKGYHFLKQNKEEVSKLLSISLILVIIMLLSFSAYSFTNSVIYQSKSTGLSANYQWQEAMDWVRDNTAKNSIFISWWDYGYFIEYLGERPSITDGGHACGFWDHLIGRYVLTTSYPETALSFAKIHNVSYLLIDQTDIGKYPAYSVIGSGQSTKDRYSQIVIMNNDPSQTQETANETIRIYSSGGSYVDKDIIYKELFLPSNRAAIIGVVLKTSKDGLTFTGAEGVFVDNGLQYRIPLKYIYYEGSIIEFKEGIDSLVRIVPKAIQTSNSLSVDKLGSIIYLSPLTRTSLFAQLYLLDNTKGYYNSFKLVHSEQDQVLNYLNFHGANVKDFIYFNGIRGPIKIWKIEIDETILGKEEFLRTKGDYAEFDNLAFVTTK